MFLLYRTPALFNRQTFHNSLFIFVLLRIQCSFICMKLLQNNTSNIVLKLFWVKILQKWFMIWVNVFSECQEFDDLFDHFCSRLDFFLPSKLSSLNRTMLHNRTLSYTSLMKAFVNWFEMRRLILALSSLFYREKTDLIDNNLIQKKFRKRIIKTIFFLLKSLHALNFESIGSSNFVRTISRLPYLRT